MLSMTITREDLIKNDYKSALIKYDFEDKNKNENGEETLTNRPDDNCLAIVKLLYEVFYSQE